MKWIAPILRNLAGTPERAAQIHVNEGVCDIFDIVFPPKGTLITPEWPAATNARSFVLLRCLGLLAGVVAQAVDGRMPADQETIRYTGFYGTDASGKQFLSREVLGGGSGGRYYADGNDAIHIVPDSRNQPAEFTETRFPLLVEKLALRTDSAGAGKRCGGLGYEKHYRALVDCRTIVTADCVRLGCYGVKGGKAGQPFCVTVDLEGEARDLGELVLKGQIVRVVTTGGGWGARPARPGRATAQECAIRHNVTVEIAGLLDTPPAAMDGKLLNVLGQAAKDLGASAMILPSGAGHDAMVMSRYMPSVMMLMCRASAAAATISPRTQPTTTLSWAHRFAAGRRATGLA